MNLLQMVNTILPYLGEATVTTTDTRHPTVGLIKQNIDVTLQSLLAEGWWFNTITTKLYPDSEGKIAAPQNALSWYSTDDNTLEIKGEYMVDYKTGSNIFTVGKAYEGTYIANLSIEELPEYAAQTVLYTVALDTYAQDIGVEKVTEFIASKLAYNRTMLTQENLRKRKYIGGNVELKARYYRALRG
jgi:hypothetical protein